ncbi:membrane-flanked domain protein [Halorubrum sp. AJ67]|nr:membrane-flanked domain protein [Halorubrum sp. AJ67]
MSATTSKTDNTVNEQSTEEDNTSHNEFVSSKRRAENSPTDQKSDDER